MPSSSCIPPVLPSFPTRRSSDLQGQDRCCDLAHDAQRPAPAAGRGARGHCHRPGHHLPGQIGLPDHYRRLGAGGYRRTDGVVGRTRSEEHTSELQSRRDLVCRLLRAYPLYYPLSLHDALPIYKARIDAVIWRTTLSALRLRPAEGLEVIAIGRVTTYPGKSAYQIIIDALEPAGIGALMALLEERDRKSTRLNSSHVEISYAVFFVHTPCTTLFPYTTLFRSTRPGSML